MKTKLFLTLVFLTLILFLSGCIKSFDKCSGDWLNPTVCSNNVTLYNTLQEVVNSDN